MMHRVDIKRAYRIKARTLQRSHGLTNTGGLSVVRE